MDEQEKKSPIWVDGVRCEIGKDGVKRYYIRYYDESGKRVQQAAKGATKEREARRVLGKKQEEVERFKKLGSRQAAGLEPTEGEIDRATISVKELAHVFREKYASPKVKPDRLEAVRREGYGVLKCHILPVLGSKAAASVTREDVVNLRNEMTLARRGPRTIGKAIGQLACLYRWALETGRVSGTNPAKGIEKPAAPESTDAYTDDEVARLLTWAASNDQGLYDLITFAFYTGARIGELAAVRWEDVNFDTRRISLSRSWKSTRKNSAPVRVHIHPRLEAVLRRLSIGKKSGDLVFASKWGKMLPRFRTWGLDKAIEETKVRSFDHPWHAFRHAHATALAMNGASITEVRDSLGQKTTVVAARYINIADERRAEYVNKMDALGPEPPAVPDNVASLDEHRAAVRRDNERDNEVSEVG